MAPVDAGRRVNFTVVPAHVSPVQPLRSLRRFQPQLVIAENFGWTSMQAAIYRSISPQSRLLLCTATSGEAFGIGQRWILGKADSVVADGSVAADALERLAYPPAKILSTSQSHDFEAFLDCRRARSEIEARRLVFAGDLTPGSGAADLLIAVIGWSERNPDRAVEIWWAGDGDLAGVLDAQPLPPGVSQRFVGRLERRDLASTFTQCGFLVVPSLGNDRRAPILEGLAAGLPVLGSRLNGKVVQLVQDGVNGWLFDPLQPEGMTAVLSRAMAAPLASLEQMRDRAQATVRPTVTMSFADRFSAALAAMMPDSVYGKLPQSAA